jgi:hypothetical protein
MKLYEITCKVEFVKNKVGQVNTGTCQHQFKSAYFAIPTSCDFCQQTIWGLGSMNKGVSCKECSYNAHVKCEMKIPPLCTGVKGLVDKKSRSVSDPVRKPDIVPSSPAIKHDVSIPSVTCAMDHAILTDRPQSPFKTTPSAPMLDSSTQIPEIQASAPSVVIKTEQEMPALEKRRTLGRSTLSLSHFKFREGIMATVLYDYTATDDEETSIKQGERITVIHPGFLA